MSAIDTSRPARHRAAELHNAHWASAGSEQRRPKAAIPRDPKTKKDLYRLT